MTAAKAGVKTCALCGRRLPDEKKRIYSHHTGSYYCGPDRMDKCRAIRRRNRKEKG